MAASFSPLLSKFQNLKSNLFDNQKPLIYTLLALFIIIYGAYFSWYTINRHNTLNSYAADLSLIDQPMWNTAKGAGGFMEQTWGDRQQPRLAEHFEPILIPLSLLFFLWDNVRILLIAQSLALALGALPVFWIARSQLALNNEQLTNSKSKTQNLKSEWAALVFSAAYLLSPQLQAANIADFHADPFVVTPLLFAFWYATQHRWRWMWLWAVIVMMIKENLPTLTAMLGLLLLFDVYQAYRPRPNLLIFNAHRTMSHEPPAKSQSSKQKIHQGIALTIVSTLWFVIATFFIVAPLARQHFGTDGPIYLANRFDGGLAALPALLQDPLRWQYLGGLLAAVGFLPILAPELIILGLPVLAANMLSNFAGQYSGEQHYSAPLVAAFIVAAIYGTRRLLYKTSLREVNRQSLRKSILFMSCLWLMFWSLNYHARRGWTPLSIRTEAYAMSPQAAQLPLLSTRIPPDAIVSASAAIHPHLAHRRVSYLFPIVQDADYLLIDVADIPGIHPNDAHTKINALLGQDWRLLEAEEGLLFAQKSQVASPQTLPTSFFDFARSQAAPAYPTQLTFGDGQLQLLGYDILDDPDDGLTFRFSWQASGTLPENLRLWPLIYDDFGQLLINSNQLPMRAAVWYPPSDWQPNEVVVTETLPQQLPDTFHLGIATGLTDSSFNAPAQRLTVHDSSDVKSVQLQAGHWAQLASFRRQGPFLTHMPPVATLQPLTALQVQFGTSIQLSGFWLDNHATHPGLKLPILLQWHTTQPLNADLTVFIHLLAPDGALVAQSDAFPTWLTPQPTSSWQPQRPVLDRHILRLPPDMPANTYAIQLGLYDAQTLERLTLPDGSNAFQVAQVQIK